jgi:hypothetical protein
MGQAMGVKQLTDLSPSMVNKRVTSDSVMTYEVRCAREQPAPCGVSTAVARAAVALLLLRVIYVRALSSTGVCCEGASA